MQTRKPCDVTVYQKNYSETGFWNKLRKAAVKAGAKVVYCALLLYYILQSPGVSARDKALIVGALGYFILPVDLVPDLLPLVGYTDDLAALTGSIMAVKANLTPEIKAAAQAKLSEWFGDDAATDGLPME